MNTISIIVSIATPLVVIAYIIWDLSSKHVAKVPKMSYDPKIDDKSYDCGENDGDILPQDEVLKNTAYIVDNYAEILLK
jgi:hypothetical protein